MTSLVRSRAVSHLVLSLVALGLAGCGNRDLTDLQDYVHQTKLRRPPPIEPLPEFTLAEGFLYDPGKRRDPFVLDRETAAVFPAPSAPGGIAPNPHRPREALERFALDSLIMRGILQQGNAIWGLVQAKEDKTLHPVTPGNYLGQNHGRIIRISEHRIDLIELIPDGAGRWLEREASLTLATDQKPK
ncbi:MAG: pilus assembly protein PilP [Chromatiaceae bacterium]|nr:pilus assembly protein PilP [Candidatus Thioaporhodococcus sediminis]